MLSSTSAFFFGTVIITHTHMYTYMYINAPCSHCWQSGEPRMLYIYIYMEHSQFADFFFVNAHAARSQNVIYTLEGVFSVVRSRLSYFIFQILSVFQQFILRFIMTFNHISSLLTNLFNKIWVSFLFSSKYDEGIHDNIHSRSVFHSIHGCMVKDT